VFHKAEKWAETEGRVRSILSLPCRSKREMEGRRTRSTPRGCLNEGRKELHEADLFSVGTDVIVRGLRFL